MDFQEEFKNAEFKEQVSAALAFYDMSYGHLATSAANKVGRNKPYSRSYIRQVVNGISNGKVAKAIKASIIEDLHLDEWS
jgi:hypothetical protein